MITEGKDCWSADIHKSIAETTSADLWRYIQKNSYEKTPEDLFLQLSQLSHKDLLLLANIHFILSDDAQNLMGKIAPAILSCLSKTSINNTNINRGKINGRISWGKTYAARAVYGGDPSVFAVNQRSSVFDLPENRVLLHMIQQTTKVARYFSNVDSNDETDIFDVSSNKKWTDKTSRLAIQGTKFLKNPYIRQIGELPHLTEKVIEETAKARGQWYSLLSNVASVFYRSLQNPFEFLTYKLGGKILEPLNRNTVYEIAVLFKVIRSAAKAGWTEQRVGLIGGTSNIISVMRKGPNILKVYYQGIPKCFAVVSKYGELMSKYGLSEGLRRPDIVLEWSNASEHRYCIIEVKRSSQREYLADGGYKLLGYLKDYESVLNKTVMPQGLLVGWSRISDQVPTLGSEVYISSWANLDNNLQVVLKNIEMTVSK